MRTELRQTTLIGGSFALLNIFYAVLSSLVQSDEKAEMTDEQYEQEKKCIAREKELQALRKGDAQGFLSRGKEAVLGQSQGADEVLERALTYLRDARELLPVDQEERAVQALVAHLNIRSKGVLPVLIQARSVIEREDQDRLIREATFEQEDDQEQEMNESAEDQEALLDTLQGRETVSLEAAARALNCQVKYVVRLRNQGKLKHGPKRDDLITVASLRSYLAARGKRGGNVATEKLKVVPPVGEKEREAASA